MATLQQFYVNPLSAGGDGTSVNLSGANAAFASLNAGLVARFAVTPDLVAADVLPKFSCFGAAADAFGLNFANYQFVTDLTRYVWIEGLSGFRHPGYYSTGHYRLAPTDFPAIAVSSINLHVFFDGVQVVPTAGLASNPIALSYLNGGTLSRLRVRNCVLHALSTTGTPTGSAAITGTGTAFRFLQLWNTVISGRFAKGVQLSFLPGSSRLIAYHNTIVGYELRGIESDSSGSGRVFVKNNRIAAPNGAGSSFNFPSTTPTSASNYTGDAGSPDGAGFQNKSFTWLDAPNYNYHLASADGFTGVDLSADAELALTTDIDGDTRSLWYAGFDEPIAAPPVTGTGAFALGGLAAAGLGAGVALNPFLFRRRR